MFHSAISLLFSLGFRSRCFRRAAPPARLARFSLALLSQSNTSRCSCSQSRAVSAEFVQSCTPHCRARRLRPCLQGEQRPLRWAPLKPVPPRVPPGARDRLGESQTPRVLAKCISRWRGDLLALGEKGSCNNRSRSTQLFVAEVCVGHGGLHGDSLLVAEGDGL